MLIVYSKLKTNRITKIPWYEFGDGLAIDISWWLVPGTKGLPMFISQDILQVILHKNPDFLDSSFIWDESDEGPLYWSERQRRDVPLSEGDIEKLRFYAREAGLIS
jgi:hypothetical protein